MGTHGRKPPGTLLPADSRGPPAARARGRGVHTCDGRDRSRAADGMTLIRRIWFFVTRWRRLQDLDAEMRLHVEMRAEANRRRGLAPDEAMRVAKLRFGNSLKLREESRDMWGFSEVERVSEDLRYALHQLIRRPTWTAIVVLTL